jgi:hypothetical protein
MLFELGHTIQTAQVILTWGTKLPFLSRFKALLINLGKIPYFKL